MERKESKKFNKRSGMTLIEILIVVTLIGILSGVMVKSLGGSLEAGKESTARLFVTTTARTAIEAFRSVEGRLPRNIKELQRYFTDKTIPETPWGNGTYEFKFGEDARNSKNKIAVMYVNGNDEEVVVDPYGSVISINGELQLQEDDSK